MGGWRKRMASPDIDVAAELGTNLTAARQTAEMQPDQPAALLWIFLLLNLAAFGAYWWDKRAAAEGRWRVSERTLLMLAFIGGSIGAVTAQKVLRHKTRKEPFRTQLMLIIVLHVVLGIVWITAPDLFYNALQAILAPA